MRVCPSCGYGSPDAAARCGVCGGDVSGVAPVPAPAAPAGAGPALVAAGLLALLCAAAAFALWPRLFPEPAPAPSYDEVRYGTAFSYDGVRASVARLGEQRFLPPGDKLRALRLLESPDPKVAEGAAGLAGLWLREAGGLAAGAPFMEALLKAAAGGAPGQRRRAAQELARSLAAGCPAAPYLSRIKAVSDALSAEGDPALASAGVALAEAAKSAVISREQLAIIKK